jgi:hypothetical protein
MITGKKALNSLFDDAIDELEVTYDVYFEIEHYRRRCLHVMNRLLSGGTNQGSVLVFGKNEKPFTMVCDKLGFQVESRRLDEIMAYGKEDMSGSASSAIEMLSDLQGPYDIIICDDVLQYLAAPAETLTVLKDNMNPGGQLMVMTPNIAGGMKRVQLLAGRNVYPLPRDHISDDMSPEGDVTQLMPYREYTLHELEMLVRHSGLELMRSEFIIGSNVNANTWPPMAVKEYVFQSLYFAVQKIAAPLRSYLFVAARRPLVSEANG